MLSNEEIIQNFQNLLRNMDQDDWKKHTAALISVCLFLVRNMEQDDWKNYSTAFMAVCSAFQENLLPMGMCAKDCKCVSYLLPEIIDFDSPFGVIVDEYTHKIHDSDIDVGEILVPTSQQLLHAAKRAYLTMTVGRFDPRDSPNFSLDNPLPPCINETLEDVTAQVIKRLQAMKNKRISFENDPLNKDFSYIFEARADKRFDVQGWEEINKFSQVYAMRPGKVAQLRTQMDREAALPVAVAARAPSPVSPVGSPASPVRKSTLRVFKKTEFKTKSPGSRKRKSEEDLNLSSSASDNDSDEDEDNCPIGHKDSEE
jgi:hypothetical protein